MIKFTTYISHFPTILNIKNGKQPWHITNTILTLLEETILNLNNNYTITNGIAIHKTTNIETGVILKRPTTINSNCFVSANSYFRAGVFLDESVKFGTLVGDNSKIGANAVLSPGTILKKNSIIKRLQLIEQITDKY